jgi:hypothetical protein
MCDDAQVPHEEACISHTVQKARYCTDDNIQIRTSIPVSIFMFVIDFLQVVTRASTAHATLPRAASRVTRVHRSVVSAKTATSAVKRLRKQTFLVLATQREKMRQNAMKKMLDMIVNIFFKAF